MIRMKLEACAGDITYDGENGVTLLSQIIPGFICVNVKIVERQVYDGAVMLWGIKPYISDWLVHEGKQVNIFAPIVVSCMRSIGHSMFHLATRLI